MLSEGVSMTLSPRIAGLPSNPLETGLPDWTRPRSSLPHSPKLSRRFSFSNSNPILKLSPSRPWKSEMKPLPTILRTKLKMKNYPNPMKRKREFLITNK